MLESVYKNKHLFPTVKTTASKIFTLADLSSLALSPPRLSPSLGLCDIGTKLVKTLTALGNENKFFNKFGEDLKLYFNKKGFIGPWFLPM